MPHTPWLDPATVRFLLLECDTWAVVGLSGDPSRTAYRIAQFLQQQGKRIVPVHPAAPTVLGEPGYATLADVPFALDCVDVFRRSEAAGEFADQAVAVGARGGVVPARRRRPRRLRPHHRGRRAHGDGHVPGDRVAAARRRGPTRPAPRPSARQGGPMKYPETRRDDTVETLHGREVADPYRWLEDPDSAETADWVRRQNALSRAHLDGLPSRAWFGETMRELVGRPRAGTPDKVGGRYVVTPQRRHPAAGPVVRRGHPRGARRRRASCCSTPTRSARTGPRRWPATTRARTAAGWPTSSATAAATGARCGCSTSSPATTWTTWSPR